MTNHFETERARIARIPLGLRIYAVGDIHGRLDLLQEVLTTIEEDQRARPVGHAMEIYLGDYIDRGPDSAGVIGTLMARARERHVVTLCGNHELYALETLNNPAMLEKWRPVGADTTLTSYGLDPLPLRMTSAQLASTAARFAKAIPQDHVEFLQSLPPLHRCGDYLFVHAGIRPGLPLARQTSEDLTMIRKVFLASEESFGFVVVHGHTPVAEPEVKDNRINIDTGAYSSGRLTCLVLEGEEAFFLT